MTDGQASIFGYKEDLGIDQTGYNLISTIFFVPYGLFEVPSQICLMYVAPHTWISVMGLAWGITMTMNGLVKNFGGAMAGRFILGGKCFHSLLSAHMTHPLSVPSTARHRETSDSASIRVELMTQSRRQASSPPRWPFAATGITPSPSRAAWVSFTEWANSLARLAGSLRMQSAIWKVWAASEAGDGESFPLSSWRSDERLC